MHQLVSQLYEAFEVWHGREHFGHQHDTNPAAADFDDEDFSVKLFFNGQATYKLTSDSNVSLFVGQRRGALRCVSGVCRVFPAFEGARLDLTLRL